MKKYSDAIVITLTLIITLILGYLSHDIIVGGTALFSAILCTYYAGKGKRINYLFGIINCVFISYAGLKNHLYGLFGFYLFILLPMQILGIIEWNKNINDEKNVKVREFTLKNSIIISGSIIVGSLLLAFLLSLIPSQNMALLDAFSNILNICAFILMILRFKECWWIWLLNNWIDLIIWIVNFKNNGDNAFMMLMVAVSYLLINFYGIIKWSIDAKKSKSV